MQAGQSEGGIEPSPQTELLWEARDGIGPLLIGDTVVEVIREELIGGLDANVIPAGGIREVAAEVREIRLREIGLVQFIYCHTSLHPPQAILEPRNRYDFARLQDDFFISDLLNRVKPPTILQALKQFRSSNVMLILNYLHDELSQRIRLYSSGSLPGKNSVKWLRQPFCTL